jgi:hypothetical protein
MGLVDLVRKVARVIETVLRRHPRAIPVLVGEVPPPDDEEVLDMLGVLGGEPGTRVSGGNGGMCATEAAALALAAWHEAVEAAGGWAGIVRAAREMREYCPNEWGMVTAYVRRVDCAGVRSRTEPVRTADRIAERFSVSPRTVELRRRVFPERLARLTLSETRTEK